MKWSNLERIVHPTWPALALLASLTIVVYAIPKGLDLTDESLYVLLAQTDAPRSLSVIHSQLLFQGLESITGVTLGIRGLRAARLALLLISTSWLAWVLSRSVGQEKKALFLSAALAFCFLQYTGNGRIFSLGVQQHQLDLWSRFPRQLGAVGSRCPTAGTIGNGGGTGRDVDHQIPQRSPHGRTGNLGRHVPSGSPRSTALPRNGPCSDSFHRHNDSGPTGWP